MLYPRLAASVVLVAGSAALGALLRYHTTHSDRVDAIDWVLLTLVTAPTFTAFRVVIGRSPWQDVQRLRDLLAPGRRPGPDPDSSEEDADAL